MPKCRALLSTEVLSTQGERCIDDRVGTMASRRACDRRPSSSPARSDCDPNTRCDGHRIRDKSVTAALPRDTRDGKPPTIAGQPIGSPVCLCLWANGKGGMTLNSRIPSPYNKDIRTSTQISIAIHVNFLAFLPYPASMWRKSVAHV